ncbi:MAG: ATP-binding cassette domain-containing protein [Rhodopseudomonas sp.]|nr:ATP-binding cassette domain-containing protein [Rhodopseudomonas sp.]
MLKLSHVEAGYRASQVLFDVNLEIPQGKVVTLLGRNGMGKTTTVRSIMGILPVGQGIWFEGQPTAGVSSDAIARRGIGLVPEGRIVFPTLTVRENLVATAANRFGRADPWTLERIYGMFPRLAERAQSLAQTLSGGEQQMLAIGRALMTNPKLLILDEATEGLAPVIRADIWHCIAALKDAGQSILLIDKNLNVLKRIADYHYVLEKGRTVWEGDSDALTRDADKVQGYVGL